MQTSGITINSTEISTAKTRRYQCTEQLPTTIVQLLEHAQYPLLQIETAKEEYKSKETAQLANQ
jgi:hypothetical protein